MIEFFVTAHEFFETLKETLKEKGVKRIFLSVLTLIFSGTLFYHEVEHWSLIDSAYFSVTTLATIGNSQLFPQTSLGKIFTIFYIFIGVGVIIGFINVMAKHATKHSPVNKLVDIVNKRK